jgi:hypothetical protein
MEHRGARNIEFIYLRLQADEVHEGSASAALYDFEREGSSLTTWPIQQIRYMDSKRISRALHH